MKRRIVCLLILTILLACTYGFAEEEKEILFRGIPWESTIAEYTASIGNDKLSGSTSNIRTIYSWEIKEGKDMDESEQYIEDGGYYVSTYPKDFFVAGVPVDNIYAYFMFTYDNDGVYTDDDKGSLYKAEYQLNPVDIGEAYSILTDKLTGLYGKGEEAHGTQKYINTTYTDNFEAITWKGANNTGVRLFVQYREESGTKEYRKLSIVYGKTNSVDLFAKLSEAMAREQKKQMLTDNNDGL